MIRAVNLPEDHESKARIAGRSGFTLVETIVAVLIASIVLIAVYQVLVTNQRVSTVQREQVRVQGTLRAGMDVIAQELRETSTAGDLTLADDDRVGFRALRTFGVVCGQVSSAVFTVTTFGRTFRQGSPVYVFRDGDPTTALDDTWIEAQVADLPTGSICEGRPAQNVAVGSASGSLGGVRRGAVVREFREVEYHLQDFDGSTFLVRTQGGASSRLVGPLDAGTGLELAYLDADGNTTSAAADVRQVRITLRASSRARWTPTAEPVRGTLTTTVFLRN